MVTIHFGIKGPLPLLFSIFISTIFLSNCARLPKPSIKNKTILVVKDEFANTSSYPPQIRIRFNIKSNNGLDGQFSVMPSNGNAIISSLEPGNYNINGYTKHAIGRVNPKKNYTYPLRLKFELRSGQITVLNRKIVAQQKPYSARGGWSFNMKIKNVTSSEKKEVINLLRKDENFRLWRVYDENNYTQKTLAEKPRYSIKPKEIDFCSRNFAFEASKEDTVKSWKKFLNKCTDRNNFRHKHATRRLRLLQNQTEPKPDPPKVVLPKVTASPKVTIQSEKSKTIIIPTGSLGKISEVRKKMLEKTLESKLDDYFDIVPKELFEEAQEQAFQEMDSDECTEERCIALIQEILQVPNAFQLIIMVEEGDTQISLTWNDMEKKRVEENYCEGCKTKELRNMIEELVVRLVGR